MNICLLGLSGSGKTCYLYTAAHVLGKGVKVNEHTLSIIPDNHVQKIKLNNGILDMSNKKWPVGSQQTTKYSFHLRIDGEETVPFGIHDFRGSMLEGLNANDIRQVEELMEAFDESACIIILIDGDTLLAAIEEEKVYSEHRKEGISQLEARIKIDYIESLIRECNKRMNRRVPVLLTITKKDIFYPDELQAGKALLKELLPSMFAKNSDMIVGITAVTLGENLSNEDGELKGKLCLNTKGNVHLPILFALFQGIDTVNDPELHKLMINLFTPDKIDFYRGGRIAILV